jgi:hypothetical protein
LREHDLGIGTLLDYSPGDHQGLQRVYFTTIKQGRLLPMADWDRWAP